MTAAASYSKATKVLTVEDAYSIKEELKVAGYRWNADSEWWEKRIASQDQIIEVWDHLIGLSVRVPEEISKFVENYHKRVELNSQPEIALKVLAMKMGL